MTGEYTVAVHALVYLAHHDKLVSSEELADNVCTNPARIRKVMSRLRKADLVCAHAGVEGGYTLCPDASEISLLNVSDALDDKIVKQPWRSGDLEKECLISSGMAGIMDMIFDGMDEECREYLSGISIADIEHKIFSAEEIT